MKYFACDRCHVNAPDANLVKPVRLETSTRELCPDCRTEVRKVFDAILDKPATPVWLAKPLPVKSYGACENCDNRAGRIPCVKCSTLLCSECLDSDNVCESCA